MKREVRSIVLTTLWISFSEFIRNEVIWKSFWTTHFESLGLRFQTRPINGFLWICWSMLYAIGIKRLMRKFSTKEVFVVTWIFGFIMMWIPLYNLQVLPHQLLVPAVPLSMLEVYVAIEILRRTS